MTPETFFENFALLADAPNGVQKLREMILQLAVRGKLVPQDPNDEPASVLLEKIEAEKEQRVKKGRIKTTKLLASSNIDSTCAGLPQGWISAPLGACVELVSGQHLLPDAQNDLGEGLPYLTGPADFGERNPIATRWTTESKSIAVKNDILITVKGAGVGKTNILGMDEVTIGRQLMAIRPVQVDHEYLYLFVRSAYGQFQALSIGL